MKSLTPARITLMMLVVVGGLIAAYVAKGLLATEQAAPEVEMRNVPMAIADLPPGTVVTEAHVGAGRITESEIQPGMLLNERAIIGRVVKETIPAATPITSTQLYQPGERPPLKVGPGMRAVSVSLSAVVDMVDGLVKPGEFVDIHMTPNNADSGDRRFRGGLTLTLFKGVKVIAINRNIQQGDVDRVGNSVTLELTPEQANIMILARDRGDITMSFNPEGKGTGGVAVSSENRATLDEILGLKPLPKPTPPLVTESYRGSLRETTSFRDGKRSDLSPGNDDYISDDDDQTLGTSSRNSDDRSTNPTTDPADAGRPEPPSA